jgi:hypothetical protein
VHQVFAALFLSSRRKAESRISARAEPFAEVFPDLAASIRKGRDADNEARGKKPKPARGR